MRDERRLIPPLRLRTRIGVPMIGLAVIPLLTLGLFLIRQTETSLWETATARVSFDTAAKARAIEIFLGDVQQDLLFLSQLGSIRELASSQAAGDADRVAALRQDAERELVIFSRGKRAYYQVRYLDAAGMEIVRLNVADGQPRIVPADELQDKHNRYYVRDTLGLPAGRIYMSPMDLNVERGQIETPARAVVRYGTGVFGPDGRRLGILVVNIDADYIFSLIGPLPPQSEAWLTDDIGRYLGYTGPSAAKRVRYGVERDLHIDQTYTAEQVTAILQGTASTPVIETPEVLLSVGRVPVTTGARRQWILLVANSREPLASPIRRVTILLSVALGLAAVAAVLIAIPVANYLARPVARLRHTIQEISAGKLSERVEIKTGDEIEGLATDFNTMMERLRDTQSSNVALEREVARQAGHLSRLQTGLARADKLASIGQMTAGVMHEIGNPLAAIKTKIQVADEEQAICAGCRPLIATILDEVNRLASFLRSFSRLAKMPTPRLEAVSPVDIVDSVEALVAPELHRRGVRLKVRVDGEVPRVRADSDQLRQLLINLVFNAAEASSSGSEIRVQLDRAPTAEAARIRVTDDGIGVDPADLGRIWDPFFTTKADGSGLGLAICRQIIDDHEGTIGIESRPGDGTTVTIGIPAAAPAPSRAATAGTMEAS